MLWQVQREEEIVLLKQILFDPLFDIFVASLKELIQLLAIIDARKPFVRAQFFHKVGVENINLLAIGNKLRFNQF